MVGKFCAGSGWFVYRDRADARLRRGGCGGDSPYRWGQSCSVDQCGAGRNRSAGGTLIRWLLKFLTGGGLKGIAAELRRAHADRLAAQNDESRIAADIDIRQLEGRQAVLIAEQGSRMTRWIRPAFAAPFIVYDCKVVVWDKVLGWGITDDLSPEFWQLQMIVFGAYFLTRPFEKRARR